MATAMAREIREAPEAIAKFVDVNMPALEDLGRRLHAEPPLALLTCARGSSHHAALWLRSLVEIHCGIMGASVSPSVNSVYGAQLGLEDALRHDLTVGREPRPDHRLAHGLGRRRTQRRPDQCGGLSPGRGGGPGPADVRRARGEPGGHQVLPRQPRRWTDAGGLLVRP